jgi:mitotic spindle assembly checkpoint protein MAD2
MMVTTDEDLIKYLNNISAQLEAWLLARSIQKLVLVVKGMETKETLERWVFDVECTSDHNREEVRSDKPLKEVNQEIQAIIRQITASVTFLPILDEPCSFDILIYADKEATVPVLWEDSDPCYIENGQKVSLRSFNTKIHKVDVSVSYKLEDFAV